MSFVDFFVLFCAVFGLASAFFVALHPNILYAAVALIFSLLSVSGLYAALGADFLAAAQLIIYVGGIIVVILFAVMMSENVYRTGFLEGARKIALPFAASLVVLVGVLSLVFETKWPFSGVGPDQLPTTERIGLALLGPYALPFQYVAIVLLSGLIGAVIVARPQYKKNSDQEGRQEK